MSLTAEAFTEEHFAKLTRGMALAEESYQLLQRRINDLDTQLTETLAALNEAEAKMQECPSPIEWAFLMEFIGDVQRGVRSIDELYEHVRQYQ